MKYLIVMVLMMQPGAQAPSPALQELLAKRRGLEAQAQSQGIELPEETKLALDEIFQSMITPAAQPTEQPGANAPTLPLRDMQGNIAQAEVTAERPQQPDQLIPEATGYSNVVQIGNVAIPRNPTPAQSLVVAPQEPVGQDMAGGRGATKQSSSASRSASSSVQTTGGGSMPPNSALVRPQTEGAPKESAPAPTPEGGTAKPKVSPAIQRILEAKKASEQYYAPPPNYKDQQRKRDSVETDELNKMLDGVSPSNESVEVPKPMSLLLQGIRERRQPSPANIAAVGGVEPRGDTVDVAKGTGTYTYGGQPRNVVYDPKSDKFGVEVNGGYSPIDSPAFNKLAEPLKKDMTTIKNYIPASYNQDGKITSAYANYGSVNYDGKPAELFVLMPNNVPLIKFTGESTPSIVPDFNLMDTRSARIAMRALYSPTRNTDFGALSQWVTVDDWFNNRSKIPEYVKSMEEYAKELQKNQQRHLVNDRVLELFNQGNPAEELDAPDDIRKDPAKYEDWLSKNRPGMTAKEIEDVIKAGGMRKSGGSISVAEGLSQSRQAQTTLIPRTPGEIDDDASNYAIATLSAGRYLYGLNREDARKLNSVLNQLPELYAAISKGRLLSETQQYTPYAISKLANKAIMQQDLSAWQELLSRINGISGELEARYGEKFEPYRDNYTFGEIVARPIVYPYGKPQPDTVSFSNAASSNVDSKVAVDKNDSAGSSTPKVAPDAKPFRWSQDPLKDLKNGDIKSWSELQSSLDASYLQGGRGDSMPLGVTQVAGQFYDDTTLSKFVQPKTYKVATELQAYLKDKYGADDKAVNMAQDIASVVSGVVQNIFAAYGGNADPATKKLKEIFGAGFDPAKDSLSWVAGKINNGGKYKTTKDANGNDVLASTGSAALDDLIKNLRQGNFSQQWFSTLGASGTMPFVNTLADFSANMLANNPDIVSNLSSQYKTNLKNNKVYMEDEMKRMWSFIGLMKLADKVFKKTK